MSSPLAQSIVDLSSADESKRLAAAGEIYRLGRATGGSAIAEWWAESELSALLHAPSPAVRLALRCNAIRLGEFESLTAHPRWQRFLQIRTPKNSNFIWPMGFPWTF